MPKFCHLCYSQRYADVRSLYGQHEYNLLIHYHFHGKGEKRDASCTGEHLFCPQCYMSRYPDLKATYHYPDPGLLRHHYHVHGSSENRNCCCTRRHRIAILVQVGNMAVWPELVPAIREVFRTSEGQADLYVHLHHSDQAFAENVSTINQDFPGVYFTSGYDHAKDILPFMYQIERLLEADIEYEFILKIQTKSNADWRNGMIDPLKDCRVLEKFRDPSVQMIGAATFIHPYTVCLFGCFDEYSRKYKIPYHAGSKFVAGTIFWVRAAPFLEFFRSRNLAHIMNDLKVDGQFMYIMERVFGIISDQVVGV